MAKNLLTNSASLDAMSVDRMDRGALKSSEGALQHFKNGDEEILFTRERCCVRSIG